ncbi:MAG: putative ABC transporter permease [Clostridia bacterium]|nr:putative ABC transporter permease [Clostridia bacterium]
MIAGMEVSTFFLVMAFLFFVGSVLGWCIEVLFRRFFSAKKWINPGFLTGPYLPLYGFGLTFMFLISIIPVDTGAAWADKLILILITGVVMTVIEYIAGLIFIKGMKIKLWDYTNQKGNIQGIICPLFSFLWTVVGAIYVLFLDGFVKSGVSWFVSHIPFAFFVGVFFGVFIVDLCHSVNLTAKITKFAKTNKVVISFERFKESIKDGIESSKAKAAESFRKGMENAEASFRKGEKQEKQEKSSFIFAFKSQKSIQNMLEEYLEWTENLKEKVSLKRGRNSKEDGAEDDKTQKNDSEVK